MKQPNPENYCECPERNGRFRVDPYLQNALDSVVYNLQDGHDIVILIAGSGLVRIGKSVLAQQVGYYIAKGLGTPFNSKNVIFDSDELRKLGHELPKNSVIILDESLADLGSTKVMSMKTRNLLDYFSECGKYNHCMILVLPDFFDLNKSTAVVRSEILLNCLRIDEAVKQKDGRTLVKWRRGVYEFYSRKGKKIGYDVCRDKKDYDKFSKYRKFYAKFNNFWTIDEDEYNSRKDEFIKRDRGKQRKPSDTRKQDKIIFKLNQHMTQQQIADYTGLKQQTISLMVSRHKEYAMKLASIQ